MSKFEYIVVPAPTKGLKAKGLRSPEARFAHALATAMNTLGKDGWDYVRADTLPAEERQGLTKTRTVYHNMLVFRRPVAEDVVEMPADPVELEKATPPVAEALPEPVVEPKTPPAPFFPRLVSETRSGWEDGSEMQEEAEPDSILNVLESRRDTQRLRSLAAE